MPTPKRRKISHDQSRLDSFFASTSSQSPSPAKTPRKNHTPSWNSVPGLACNASGALVFQPADPCPMIRTDDAITPAGTLKAIEIIDVDLIDDVDPHTISSTQESSSRESPKIQLSQASGKKAVKFNLNPAESQIEYGALSIDPVVFNTESYIASFPKDSRDVPYSFLAHALSTICGTRSRTVILHTLTNTFRTILAHHPDSLIPAIYLLSNTLSPPYIPIEMNIGGSIISQAIQHISGLSASALKKLYNSTGDLGDVAFSAKSNTRTLIPHPPLRVPSVYASLIRVADAKGQGASKQKQSIIEKLLVAAKGEEVRFLVRTLSQNLRVGAVRTTLLTALARSFILTPVRTKARAHTDGSEFCISEKLLAALAEVSGIKKKKATESLRDQLDAKLRKAEKLVRKVFVQHPNYDHIIGALLTEGFEGLTNRVPLTVGVPLFPTLGTPIRSLQEIYQHLGELPFTAELKFTDGTSGVQYPDVIALVEEIFQNHPETYSFILDSEIVAINPLDGSLKSFQELSNRPRKEVSLKDVLVPVGVFAFDLMYLDGQVLLESSFRIRRSLLRDRFPPLISENAGVAQFKHVECWDSEVGQDHLEETWDHITSRNDTEGLMVKLLDHEAQAGDNSTESRRRLLSAGYDADKRTYSWMKLKRDYVSGIGDSLDLIPIGAWHGNGRKAQWWSPVLLGIWDDEKGYPVAVCKCMSGFTDAFYKSMRERYSLSEDPNTTCSKFKRWECETGGLKPGVYFKPTEVWEVRGADITISPISVAAKGIISSNKGLSLRFPRFIKTREDKPVNQASTPEFLASLWQSRKGDTKRDTLGNGDDLIDIEYESPLVSEDSELEI
ncbi:dna ligase [Moniliophthora roreri]|uniref:ATP-dependent DNA ligase family profile domain-containing protein n=1 Tax=Moniliophthora roreri TaxID=221103 RepID=A0A0W0F0E4_MONRR|nr:dna ligase [Moniliophthora roreri]